MNKINNFPEKFNLFFTFGYIFLFLSFFVLFPSSISAHETDQSHIFLINQVRGSECCDVGSIDTVKLQLQKLHQLNLAATFVLRSDAVKDAEYKKLFAVPENKNHELGIFLEITPELAKAAGVPYKGPAERWYKAQNAFLVGYEPSDRQKLIEYVFSQFHQQFGYYPSTVAGWMIDSWSASYMVQKYGVTAIEVTREQWGTDSYTLYGGPASGAYFPSKNWLLIPAAAPENALPAVVLRQTTTDPLYTYGDSTSTFTSQPNDYLREKRNLSYFENILKAQVLDVPANGTAVVGLENSMAIEPYQNEYFKQLELISHIVEDNHPKVEVETAKNFSEHELSLPHQNTVQLVSRSDHDQTAYWIATPFYRLRLIIKDTHVFITDLRVYGDNLEDPYAKTSTQTANAYWVVPFLLDSSRYFQQHQTLVSSWEQKVGRWWQAVRKQAVAPDLSAAVTRNEFDPIQVTGIELPQRMNSELPKTAKTSDGFDVSYQSSATQRTTLHLNKETFSVSPIGVLGTRLLLQPEIEQMLRDGKVNLNSTSSAEALFFTPKVDVTATMQGFLNQHPQQFSPESVPATISQSQTQVMYNARTVIAGQNPARVVIQFKGLDGKVAVPGSQISVVNQEAFDKVIIQQPETAHGQYYLDFYSSKTEKVAPVIVVNDQKWPLQSLRFIFNCKSQPGKCLTHPTQAFWFGFIKLDNFIHGR